MGAHEGLRHPRRRHDAPGARPAHPVRQGHGEGRHPNADGHIAGADVAEVGEDAVIRHDAHAKDPGLAFALSRLSNPRTLQNTPIGVFRDINRPSYDRLVREQLADIQDKHGVGDLQSLLNGSDTWSVS
jgi:2-oxoglutarate ferredoxin oxidoreductase subunit beta